VEKAVELATEIGAKPEEGKSRLILGMIYRNSKEWDKAAEEFKKVGAIVEVVGNKRETVRFFYENGIFYKAKGEPVKAKEQLEKALSEFKQMGMMFWAEKCRKALSELG